MKNNATDILAIELKDSKNSLIEIAKTIANNSHVESNIDEEIILKLCEEVFEFTRIKINLIELLIEKNKHIDEINKENLHLLSFTPASNRQKTYKVDKVAKVALQFLWMNGDVRWVKPQKFLTIPQTSQSIRCSPQSVYCNYSKLGLEPLKLIEKNDENRVRLNKFGCHFMMGKIKIPNLLVQNSETKQWTKHPNAVYISYDEIAL